MPPFIQITALSAPATARPGDRISATWTVRNTGGDTTVLTQFIQFIDTTAGATIGRESFGLAPGASRRGSTFFTMPNRDLTLRVEAGFGTSTTTVMEAIVQAAALPPTPPEDLLIALGAIVGLAGIVGVILAVEAQKAQR